MVPDNQMTSPLQELDDRSEEADALSLGETPADAVSRWEKEANAEAGEVAENDRITSAFKLASLHWMGHEEVEQDYGEAKKYLRIGIEAGDRIKSSLPEFLKDSLRRAYCNLADILAIGRGGVEPKEKEAFSLFWKAHKDGHIPGTYSVAYYLQLKRIQERLAADPKYQDVAAAVAEKSAKELLENAACGFAELAEESSEPYHLFCSAFMKLQGDACNEPQVRTAVTLLQQACGSPSIGATVARSQNYLGSLYYFGTAGSSEHAAFAAFKMSADRQYSLGESNLAYCYQHGIGVDPDEETARKLIRKAEERGYDQEWSDWTFNWFPAIREMQIVQGWNLRRVAEGRRCFQQAERASNSEPGGECLTVEVKHFHVGQLTDELFNELSELFLDALSRKRGSPRWRPNFSLVTRWCSGAEAEKKLALWCRIRHAQLVTRMKEDGAEPNQVSEWQQTLPKLGDVDVQRFSTRELSNHVDTLELAAESVRHQAVKSLEQLQAESLSPEFDESISRLRALAFSSSDVVGIATAAEMLGLSKHRTKILASQGRIGRLVDGRYLFSTAELRTFAKQVRPTGIHRQE